MSDVVSVLVFLVGLALVTVVCVVASRRLGGRPRTADHAAAVRAQQQAMGRRDAYKSPGPF